MKDRTVKTLEDATGSVDAHHSTGEALSAVSCSTMTDRAEVALGEESQAWGRGTAASLQAGVSTVGAAGGVEAEKAAASGEHIPETGVCVGLRGPPLS